MGILQSSEQQHRITFTEHLRKQASLQQTNQSVLGPGTARPHPLGDIRTTCPPAAMLPGYSQRSQAGTEQGLASAARQHNTLARNEDGHD